MTLTPKTIYGMWLFNFALALYSESKHASLPLRKLEFGHCSGDALSPVLQQRTQLVRLGCIQSSYEKVNFHYGTAVRVLVVLYSCCTRSTASGALSNKKSTVPAAIQSSLSRGREFLPGSFGGVELQTPSRALPG